MGADTFLELKNHDKSPPMQRMCFLDKDYRKANFSNFHENTPQFFIFSFFETFGQLLFVKYVSKFVFT